MGLPNRAIWGGCLSKGVLQEVPQPANRLWLLNVPVPALPGVGVDPPLLRLRDVQVDRRGGRAGVDNRAVRSAPRVQPP